MHADKEVRGNWSYLLMLTNLDWHLYLRCSGCMPLAVGCYTAHPRRDDSASHSYWHFLHACMQREGARSPEVSLVGPAGLASIAMANDIASQRTDQINDENEVPSAGWCIMQCNAMQCRLRKGDRKVGLFTINWRTEGSITMHLMS